MTTPYSEDYYDQPTEELVEYEIETDEESDVVRPVEVCLVNPVVSIDAPPQHTTFHTFVLTEGVPALRVLPQDPLRSQALLLALGHDVVLTGDKSLAEDAANADATLAAPKGAVLPSSATSWLPVSSTDQLWAVANTFPTRVSVVVTRRGQ